MSVPVPGNRTTPVMLQKPGAITLFFSEILLFQKYNCIVGRRSGLDSLLPEAFRKTKQKISI